MQVEKSLFEIIPLFFVNDLGFIALGISVKKNTKILKKVTKIIL